MLRVLGQLLHPIAQLRRVNVQVLRRLHIGHASILDQAHGLKLELSRKLPSLHDPPPAPSKHLTRCLRNRVQASLTFGSAARQGIICNYKVVFSVVDGQEINDFALKHGITLVAGDLIGARWVANQIAVERAVEKSGAKRAITFHSRVSSAKEFSSDGTRGIRQFLPEFSVFHVNGEQKSSERKQIIRWFRDASDALITNPTRHGQPPIIPASMLLVTGARVCSGTSV